MQNNAITTSQTPRQDSRVRGATRSLAGKLGISICCYLLVLTVVAGYALFSILMLRRDVNFLSSAVLISVQQSGVYRSAVIRALARQAHLL